MAKQNARKMFINLTLNLPKLIKVNKQGNCSLQMLKIATADVDPALFSTYQTVRHA